MKNIFKPILFSTPMVQAILQGKKTQTRRIIKPQPEITEKGWKWEGYRPKAKYNTGAITCFGRDVSPTDEDGLRLQSKIQIGDILWVRETWKISPEQCTWQKYSYMADYPFALSVLGNWKPSIHMPKQAARIFLYVTNVRVEHLHDISEADAIAEGVKLDPYFGYWCSECDKGGHIGHTPICEDGFFKTAKEAFRSLWISINGLKSWNENPYVWIYDFEVIEKPKDFI